jgi:UDP-N-acetyl-2-amino-2-deoxyglucuronate dehydrogenase
MGGVTAAAPLRVGLIGLGAVAEQHLAAYLRVPGIEVVAGADPRDDRRALFAAQRLCCYEGHGQMLRRENLDVACVLTPAASHEQVALDCAAAGVHVLCEKPLAPGADAARCMSDGCRSRGIQLFYGSSYRFLPAISAARDLIIGGAIGDILLLRESVVGGRGRESQRIMPYSHYPEGGPGGSPMGLLDHGIHLLDILPWLAGTRVTRAFGRGNVSGQPLVTEYALLEMANGAVAQLLYDDGTFATTLPAEGVFSWGCGWGADGLEPAGQWQADPGCIHVHGTRGALRILHYANALFVSDRAGLRQLPLSGSPAPGHFGAQLAQFADDLRSGRPATTPAEAGIAALDVLQAINASQRTGRMIDVTAE